MSASRAFVEGLDNQSVTLLKAMLGQYWRGFYAWELPEEENKFLIYHGGVSLHFDEYWAVVASAEHDLNLNDVYGDEIGHIFIEKYESVTQQEDDYEFHRHYSGQSIRDIKVIQETVRGFRDGQIDWQFKSDYGLVFELESGFISITKPAYMGDFLDVNIAPKIGELDIHWGSEFWTDEGELDPGESYEAERSFISVRKLTGV